MNRHHITVFEHERIKLGQCFYSEGFTLSDTFTKQVVFDEPKLHALQKFYGDKGVPYFSLTHNGIQFNEFVGVIQVGNLLIEVLPKADKSEHSQSIDKKWRNMLINMMRAVGSFDIKVTSSSHLKIKPNTVLDLYIEMFINEVEYLLHTGLIKKYRKTEENSTALKGSLVFGKQLQQNLSHKERFYVRHNTYDIEHQWHILLFTAIKFIKQINTNATLHSRIGALLLFFPEMPTAKITETHFSKLVYDRKTECYRKTIEIAKLLLLQYHPDVSKGRNNVLALMFDMNKLWEQFVYVSLRKHAKDYTITAQTSKYFWQPENGYRSKIRPDIVIKSQTECFVLDTKWKNLNGYNPSSDDLRQMFVYHEYYSAKKVALVYPGEDQVIKGNYYHFDNVGINIEKECSIFSIKINQAVKDWQFEIYDRLLKQLT
jgi:5-methylcytosine-specific restriction enzyme subunit McrC